MLRKFRGCPLAWEADNPWEVEKELLDGAHLASGWIEDVARGQGCGSIGSLAPHIVCRHFATVESTHIVRMLTVGTDESFSLTTA